MPKKPPPPAYSPEFRRRMIELVRAGRSPASLAKDFEPSAQTIATWVEQADLDEGKSGDGLTTDDRAELAQLRRDNKVPREEREILKKFAPWSVQESNAPEAFRFVKAHRAVHSVRTMCRLLDVSPSGFYASVDRPLSTRAKEDVVLTAQLEAAHEESRGTYGAPRLHTRASWTFDDRRRHASLRLRARRHEALHGTLMARAPLRPKRSSTLRTTSTRADGAIDHRGPDQH